MDGLTVRQKHNAQEAILHLRHLYPAPNSAISLHGFAKRLPDGLFNPLLSDESAIGPATDCFKVACDLHLVNVADSPFVRSFCRITSRMTRREAVGVDAAVRLPSALLTGSHGAPD